jgi:hypothetical protein
MRWDGLGSMGRDGIRGDCCTFFSVALFSVTIPLQFRCTLYDKPFVIFNPSKTECSHERKKKQIEINDWYQYYRSSPVILEHDHQYYGCSVDRKNAEEKHHCLHKSHFASFRRNQQSY